MALLIMMTMMMKWYPKANAAGSASLSLAQAARGCGAPSAQGLFDFPLHPALAFHSSRWRVEGDWRAPQCIVSAVVYQSVRVRRED